MKNYKRFVSFFVFVIICISFLFSTLTANASENHITEEARILSNATIEDNFAEDRVLVVLNKQASRAFNLNGFTEFPEIKSKNIQQINRLVRNNIEATLKTLSEISSDIPLKMVLQVEGLKNVNANNYREILCINLEESGKENVLEAIRALEQRDDILYVGPDYTLKLAAVPNDTRYSQYQQSVANKVKLPNAWGIQTNAESVIVGILDSGIDCEHPDLQNRVVYNMCKSFLSGYPESDWTDGNGHGTHVAGIVGAQGNNTIGVSGVCWNVQLASLKVAGALGMIYSSTVSLAIDYATEKGIDILNLSAVWDSNNVVYDMSLYTSIGSYPGLFVCSAGNSGLNCDIEEVYLANYNLSNLITVGASSLFDEVESYSNYGATTVDIFAPGTVYSCITDFDDDYDDDYDYKIGSSMSAPLVAGVAALYFAKNPNATAEEAKKVILYSADKSPAFTGKCVSGGRLNAYAALNHVHNCSNYTSVSPSKHRAYCSACGATFFESHSFTSSGISQICTKCGFSIQLMKINQKEEVE